MERKYQIGNFIMKCREEKNMTQSKLGELLGVSNKAISKWENGKSLPNTKLMSKLCEILEVSLEELLNGERSENIDNNSSLTEFEHVFKYYNNDSKIEIGLYDINISFNLGEIVAVCGVSGSGKTTLIKIIGGLDTIESGEIYLHKEGISRFDEIDFEEYRKSYISYIFQDYGILENYSILDNLLIVRLLMGDNYKTSLEKAIELLKEINLYQFRNKKASKLSGGQKQKLSVARAIIKDSPILLGDEITANLDSKQAKEILSLVMSHSMNKLIILVTHNYSEIEQYVTRKISLSDGKIIEDIKLKNIEKKPLKITKKNVKERLTLPLVLFGKYFKTNILKNLLLIFIVLISSFTILGVNYLCNYAYEKNKYSTDNSVYALNEIEILNKEGFTKDQLNELYYNDLVNDFKIYSYLFARNLIVDNTLKDNEIKVPYGSSYIYLDIQGEKLIVEGKYIESKDKKDNNFYLNYQNYLLVHKLITTITEFSSFVITNQENVDISNMISFTIDLNSKDDKIKSSLVDINVYFNEQEIEVEPFLEGKTNNLYISPKYLDTLLEPFIIVAYDLTIKYDFIQKGKMFDFLNQKKYLYIDNDSLEPLLQSNEMLFVLESLFVFLSLFVFIIIVLVTNKTLFSFVKSRKTELALLRKIGFSKKMIIRMILCPVIITSSVLLMFCFVCPLIVTFNLIDFYLLMIVEESFFTYFIIKNLINKSKRLIEEESK